MTEQVHTSSRKGLQNSVLGTRNLMTVAALSVVGALIVVPMTYLGVALGATPRGVITSAALMGVWVIPYLLPIAVVRRAGASIIAGFVIGVITAFAHPAGVMNIMGSVLGALFIEIPLAIMLYRKWTNTAFFISGAVFGTLNGLLYVFSIASNLPATSKVIVFVISVVSALVGTAVTLLITRLLRNAGVGIVRDTPRAAQ